MLQATSMDQVVNLLGTSYPLPVVNPAETSLFKSKSVPGWVYMYEGQPAKGELGPQAKVPSWYEHPYVLGAVGGILAGVIGSYGVCKLLRL